MQLARLTLAAALAFAGAAHAQTLLGGGNRLAFPILINQSGSYKLAGNLVVPPGVSGIVINASDVTLDLNGFTLQGPNRCQPNPGGPGVVCTLTETSLSGIIVQGPSGVVVRNGTVRGFAGDGVYLGGGSRAEALSVTENVGQGLYLGSGSIASGIVSRLNRHSGIYALSSQISDVAIERNGDHGVVLHGASLLRGGTLLNNAGFAVVGIGTSSGYRDLVMVSPGGAYGHNAVPLGNNLCGGVPC